MLATLNWHKDDLKQRKLNLKEELNHIQMMVSAYAGRKRNMEKLERQIKKAKEAGLTQFNDLTFNP